jgi:HSP20 family protein
MAKDDKGKEITVKKEPAKKESAKKEVALAPLRPLSPLRAWEREIERMFADFPFFRWPRFRDLEPFRFARELRLETPALDMYEEKDAVVVKAEMPGISKDDIEITLRGSTLSVKGEKKREEEVRDKDYYRCEREYGSFLRTVELPAEVKADAVKATFKDGVLEVRLPKTEEAKKKEVRVSVQ